MFRATRVIEVLLFEVKNADDKLNSAFHKNPEVSAVERATLESTYYGLWLSLIRRTAGRVISDVSVLTSTVTMPMAWWTPLKLIWQLVVYLAPSSRS